MSKLGGLIQGQDVAFDTHQADGQDVRWRQLHLEKRLHGGGKIRYHMFDDRESQRSSRVNEETYGRVTREVRRALSKNPRLTEELAKTVANEIHRFSTGQATVEDAQEAARKVAGYFDLSPDFVAAVARYANNNLAHFVSQHASLGSPDIKEISISAKEVSIRRAKSVYTARIRDPKIR